MALGIPGLFSSSCSDPRGLKLLGPSKGSYSASLQGFGASSQGFRASLQGFGATLRQV